MKKKDHWQIYRNRTNIVKESGCECTRQIRLKKLLKGKHETNCAMQHLIMDPKLLYNFQYVVNYLFSYLM